MPRGMGDDVGRKRPHVLALLTSKRELLKLERAMLNQEPSKYNAKLLAEENRIMFNDLASWTRQTGFHLRKSK
jgi:hypothetical protein